MDALIIFPHQLFEDTPRLAVGTAFLVEDPLYFALFAFHQQKLVLHRATMQMHAAHLRHAGMAVEYIESEQARSMADVLEAIGAKGVLRLHHYELSDDWLERRLVRRAAERGIALTTHPSPMFLTPRDRLREHFADSRHVTMAPFYVAQRTALEILLENGGPAGGRWSFDAENRRRLPRDAMPPRVTRPDPSAHVVEAVAYVERCFPSYPGRAADFAYPASYDEARTWLEDFLQHRLAAFGDFEDAIAREHAVLYHSVLTPMLNVGLLTPRYVLQSVMEWTGEVPLNSLEGFVRQIIGWREYMHGAYLHRGRVLRTRNFFGHHRPMPRRFWNAGSGIEPVDTVIRRVLKCGYAHHIERLMVLSGFMLLCEFDPSDVYRFFMELFVDAYDWVMVPNVYGMGQYTDGGGIMTKPYLCGSNYILKMSDFERGPWCAVWDGLYWRFLAKNRERLADNPRLSVIARGLGRMNPRTLASHVETAEQYLETLES